MSDEGANAVYVTGASRGIGRLLALHLARGGMSVVAMARPSDDLDSLAREAAAARLTTVAVDVTDPAAVRAAFTAGAKQVGAPTTLITCAGSIDALGPVAEVDPDRWWSAVTVDLRGTMLAAQAALTLMLPSRRGRIVTVYGNLGDRGLPNVSAFAAAKAGIARFTETLANELDGTGLTVIGVHPGFVRTSMTERLASSDEGQQWLPAFGTHAEQNWGDGHGVIELIDQITNGEADSLAGRIIYASDNLAELAREVDGNPNLRRLRLHPA